MGVGSSSLKADSWPKLVGLVESLQLLCDVLHSSDELSQSPCHSHSTVNVVLVLYIIVSFPSPTVVMWGILSSPRHSRCGNVGDIKFCPHYSHHANVGILSFAVCVYYSVCLGRIASKTAERISLKFTQSQSHTSLSWTLCLC